MQIPTLIDNIEGNTLQKVLENLLLKSVRLDIATGTFEIGAFLSLGETWQHLDGVRLLMGDETTRRTKEHLVRALQEVTDANIESEKEQDDTLQGLAAVREAIRKGQITVRVYDKAKFHAKLNVIRAQNSSPVDFATVGSSNFTRPGLTQNVELNSFIIYHLINYFGQNQRTHFAKIGVHDFRKYFRDMESQFEDETTEIAEQVEEDDFLRQDPLLKQVLIQRSRKYIKEAEQKSGIDILFPERVIEPTVDYSVRRVYRTLYDELQAAFDRQDPFLNLAIYNTVKYHKKPERRIEQREKLVIGLIRTLVLKRLESSWRAFEATIENLLLKMADWLKKHAPERFGMWEGTNRRWWRVVQEHILERLQEDGISSQTTPENLQRSIVSNPSEEEDDLASVGVTNPSYDGYNKSNGHKKLTKNQQLITIISVSRI